jgi:hypothetical protein
VLPRAPSRFVLDGAVGEWTDSEPSFHWVSQKASATIWLGRTIGGIVVAGRAIGYGPWAANPAELTTKTRLEIGLSVAEPFEFTPSNQSGRSVVSDTRKKAGIDRVNTRFSRRENLVKLFRRRWCLSPAAAQETWALPAYDSLSEAQRDALPFPRPAALPQRKFRTTAGDVMEFEIFIPWEIFPPADRLNLERISLLATVSSYFTSDELAVVGVSPPISSRITTCAQPLANNSFYFLSPSLAVEETFAFEEPQWEDDADTNSADNPNSSEFAFRVGKTEYFSQELGKGEFLCGPFLSYRKGSIIRQSSIYLEHARGDDGQPTSSFPVKRLADGTWLIKYGPEMYTDPSWRKAMLIYSLRLFALSPSLSFREVMSLGARTYDIPGYGTEISDDWLTVTEFIDQMEWTSEKFCWTGHTFKGCGKNPNSPPPKELAWGDGR